MARNPMEWSPSFASIHLLLIFASVSFGCSDPKDEAEGPCGAPATPIHAVQGAGRSSPLLSPTTAEGEIVVEAIVVGPVPDTLDGLGGFFLQEEDADVDDDPRTSEGLFVFDAARDSGIRRGDRVRVRGRVAEFFGLTELTAVRDLVVCPGGGRATPAMIELPLDDETDWERWEGMGVAFAQPLVVTGQRNIGRFGEVTLAAGSRLEQPTQREEPGDPAIALAALNRRGSFLLDDGRHALRPEPTHHLDREDGGTLRLGDALDHLEGVLGFSFGRFRVHPTQPVRFVPGDPRPLAPPDVGGRLRVVGWNVENYMNGDGRGGGFPTRGPADVDEFERQRAKIVETLLELDPDIAALVELENDGTEPESAIAQLLDELNGRVPGAPFALVEPDPTRLGTHPIAVGMFYRRDTLERIGPAAILDARAHPGFDDRRNRPGLAQTFRALETGERLTVVVNHFKSKGSNCDAVNDPDVGDGQGECNRTRAGAAGALVEWLATDPTGAADAPILLLGDLNAYPAEDPLRILESAGYADLVSLFDDPGEYTFVFAGQAGRLDHAWATSDLLPVVSGVGVWHVNADEAPVLDYRLENPPGRFVADPFRSSDHDPILVGLFPDGGGNRCRDEG